MGHVYHAAKPLPSAQEIARVLGGRIRQDGAIAFPDLFEPKPGKRPCTLWLTPGENDGFRVADAAGRRDALALKDKVRLLIGVPFAPRHQNSNGSAQRAARGPSVRDRSAEDHRNGEGGAASRLYLLQLDAIKLGKSRRDLIKGLIPRVGLTIVYGAPKSGKSFLSFDLAMHVAMGLDYRERRVHQGPAVYCYFEGQVLASARVEAFRQQRMAESAEGVPFYLMPVTIDLVAEHLALIAAIRSTLGKTNPVVIVLDTLNRSFVGSESSDQDMSAYVKAADAIREAFECAVVVVHHCGHDATRPRGHTALIGAADAVIAVKKESAGQLIATVEMMKDGPHGQQIAGRLEVVEVGRDEDGEPITSCVVAPVEISTIAAMQPRATGAAGIALDLLKRALADTGEAAPASNHIPRTSRTTTIGLWRRYFYEGMVGESDKPDSRQKAFARASKRLQELGLIGIWGEHVWMTGHAGH